MTDNTPVASPCISVCLLDNDDVCVGCYRTADEITDWMAADNGARREILARAQQRCRQRSTHQLK
ncbi:MAG TPA: DUF1289 domain-containing protein [Pseudomonadales bacterium]